jgi:putative DNA primase/helicase
MNPQAAPSTPFETFPDELRTRPQWVVWRYADRDGPTPSKPPYNARTKQLADKTEPKDWSTYEQALATYHRGGFDGIGFCFSKTDPYCGIDLDHCRNQQTGEIQRWARELIHWLQSYTEVSPTGTGVHIFTRAVLAAGGMNLKPVEIYDAEAYFTVTGHHLRGTPTTPQDRQEETATLYADRRLYQKAKGAKNGRAFLTLWAGEWTGYPSQSEADQALTNILAFWTKDPTQIDRLFRQSGLYRDKWDDRHAGDGRTYGQMTIAKALASHTTFSTNNSPPPVDTVHSPEPAWHCTDLGNGERLAHRHGEILRYCALEKTWLVWDQQRWALDITQRVKALAHDTTRAIYVEAGGAASEIRRKELAKHAMASESEKRLNAMANIAQALLPIVPAQLDRDPWLFNVNNGTLNLRTGELRQHRKEDLISKLAPLVYNQDAQCPTWLAFLNTVMNADQSLIDYVQRVVGYALTGQGSERCFFFLYGSGDNGKSVFLSLLSALLGEYGHAADITTFLRARSDRIRDDIADLQGARVITTSESNAGRQLDEGVVKKLTGRDEVRARHLFGKLFSFVPTAKIFLAANNKPVVSETSNAIWNRVKQIPFVVTIPKEQQDPELPEKLKGELSGILLWALEGCYRWQQEGLKEPEAVTAATAAYRREMDMIGSFLEQCCEQKPHLRVKASELYNAFIAWSGDKNMKQNAFGRELSNRGFERASQRWIVGLALTDTEDQP